MCKKEHYSAKGSLLITQPYLAIHAGLRGIHNQKAKAKRDSPTRFYTPRFIVYSNAVKNMTQPTDTPVVRGCWCVSSQAG